MIRLSKVKLVVLLVFSALLLLTNGFYYVNTHTIEILSYDHCPDIPVHFESIHASNLNVFLVSNSDILEFVPLSIAIDLSPVIECSFTDSYFSNVWQPPRLA